jgi:hypothetical protein
LLEQVTAFVPIPVNPASQASPSGAICRSGVLAANRSDSLMSVDSASAMTTENALTGSPLASVTRMPLIVTVEFPPVAPAW